MSRYEYRFQITHSYGELLKWVYADVVSDFDNWLFLNHNIDTDEVTLNKEDKYKYLDEFIEDEINSMVEVLDDNPTIAKKRTKLVRESLREDIIKFQQGQDIIDEFNCRKPKL